MKLKSKTKTRSKSETGHAKNVSNFEKLIACCISFGIRYQPSKGTIQLQEMQQLLLESRGQLLTVTERLTLYNIAKNARIQAFEDLPNLTGRIINALAATDASKKTVDDARGIARKIKGIQPYKKENASSQTESATPTDTTEDTTGVTDANPTAENTNGTTDGNNETTRSRSSAQTSRDQQIEHFARLLWLLQNEMSYQPNEPELQIQSLQMYLETMRMTNSAMMVQEAELSSARIQRDETLYREKSGICDVAQDVKLYVKSVFGLSSPQYKQLSRLKFVRY